MIQILGTILAPQKSEWKGDVNNSRTWIVFSEVDGLSLNGTGVIDGQGSEWWNKKEALTEVISSYFLNKMHLILRALSCLKKTRKLSSYKNSHKMHLILQASGGDSSLSRSVGLIPTVN